MPDTEKKPSITGRCYCGAIRVTARAQPRAVTYCHCVDCRRVTGAPVAAFAAFASEDVTFSPDAGRAISPVPGVTRTFCPACGSPITGRYAYLPGTVYLPLGLLDQAETLPPALHAHFGERLPWLRIEDDLPREAGSARARLSR